MQIPNQYRQLLFFAILRCISCIEQSGETPPFAGNTESTNIEQSIGGTQIERSIISLGPTNKDNRITKVSWTLKAGAPTNHTDDPEVTLLHTLSDGTNNQDRVLETRVWTPSGPNKECAGPNPGPKGGERHFKPKADEWCLNATYSYTMPQKGDRGANIEWLSTYYTSPKGLVSQRRWVFTKDLSQYVQMDDFPVDRFDIKIRHSENAGTRDTVTYGNIRVTLEKPDLDFGKTYKASTANLWASLKATTTDNGRTWTIEKVVIPPMKT